MIDPAYIERLWRMCEELKHMNPEKYNYSKLSKQVQVLGYNDCRTVTMHISYIFANQNNCLQFWGCRYSIGYWSSAQYKTSFEVQHTSKVI